MLVSLNGYSQTTDTLYIDESAVDAPIIYSAKDSIYTDLKNKQIHLFNEAQVDNGEVKLKAGYILIDLNKSEIYALAKQQYFAGDSVGFYQTGNEFLHTENFILVDPKRRIRGVYNGTLLLEIDRIKEDIHTLQLEVAKIKGLIK